MEIAGLPGSVIRKLPDNAAFFSFQVSRSGNFIQLSYKFGINKIVYTNAEYADIKTFFNEIVSKHAEPVVLKRKI
jgi:hypothetical protein